MKYLKRLLGKTNVENVLQRLDLLTEDCSAKSNESHQTQRPECGHDGVD